MVFIRPATADDQRAITRLVRSARINPLGLAWERFLVGTSVDGIVVGVGQVKGHKLGARELASIAVTPSHMKMGIAALIIEALLVRETGDVHLYCERGLAHFYRRFGFEQLSDDRSIPVDILRHVRLARAFMRLYCALRGRNAQLVVMRRTARPTAHVAASLRET